MVNETLMYNVTQHISSIFTNTIGIGPSDGIGMYLIGIILLVIFLFWIFKSGLGLWGTVVIIPALLVVMTADRYGLGLFPAWISSMGMIFMGLIWGFVILRLFREA